MRSRHHAAKQARSTALSPALVVETPGLSRRAVVAFGDLLGLAAIISCVPIVILAIGIPIALFLRLLLWVGGVR
jgi:hypothetical protein